MNVDMIFWIESVVKIDMSAMVKILFLFFRKQNVQKQTILDF